MHPNDATSTGVRDRRSRQAVGLDAEAAAPDYDSPMTTGEEQRLGVTDGGVKPIGATGPLLDGAGAE